MLTNAANAINVSAGATDEVVLRDLDVEMNHCGEAIVGGGINAEPSAPSVEVLIRDSRITGTSTAVTAANDAIVRPPGRRSSATTAAGRS